MQNIRTANMPCVNFVKVYSGPFGRDLPLGFVYQTA